MNREGAETFLRLAAEAELRGQLASAPPPWAGSLGAGRTKVMVVGRALTAVGALEGGIVESILADLDLAVSVRQISGPPSRGVAGAVPPGILSRVTGSATAVARQTAQIRFGPPGSLARAGRAARSQPAGITGSPEPTEPEPADEDPDRGSADRFVPVGLTVPFHDEGISGDLYLMSFAHTGSGARFIAVWGLYTPTRQLRLGLRHPDLIPFELFTVADDRGARYDLDFTPGDGPEWTSEISLRPTPPDDVRWLDVAAPLSPAMRIDLGQGRSPANGEPGVREAKLSRGEHLLIMLAEWLLTVAPEFSHDLRRGLAAPSPGMLQAMTAALGDIIAGLEAADVLSPLSPVPARLAALCASLRIGGHGIAAPPTDDLPERWLSLLAHYQRRKPDTALVRDGYAAVAAALPELDGIRLALLGLHNTEGTSYLHVLAQGMTAEQAGPVGVDLDFPLSVWLRDSGGRWHAARPAGWHGAGPRNREYAVRLRLVPPLPQSTTWVEVLAGGRSAEVRTKLPLRWGLPS